MILKELLTLIGFSKIQQISLIKILFFIGALGLSSSENNITNNFNLDQKHSLSYYLNSSDNFNEKNEHLPDESAELILENLKFDNKEKAFEWLNSLLQHHFYKNKKLRLDTFNKSKYFIELTKNLNLDKEITIAGYFDYIIVLGTSGNNFKSRMNFLETQLNNKAISTSKIFLLSSDLPSLPYFDSEAEHIISQKLSDLNKKHFQDNLEEVQKVFIKVAANYLKENNISPPSDLENIRKFFKENSSFYKKYYLLSKLKKDELLKGISWPTEIEVNKKAIPESLLKYDIQTIAIPKRKFKTKEVRANTVTSAKTWLKIVDSQNIHKKAILLVTSQPFAQYQLNTFKSTLTDQFDINVIATNNNKDNLSMLLEQIASIVHSSKNLIVKNKIGLN